MTARCTGHCCATFYLPFDPGQLRTFGKMMDRGMDPTGEGRVVNYSTKSRGVRSFYNRDEMRKVVDMVIPLRMTNRRGYNEWHYTCKHFDKATRNCTDYENRPAMCSGYPYGRACVYRGCTFKEPSGEDRACRPALSINEGEIMNESTNGAPKAPKVMTTKPVDKLASGEPYDACPQADESSSRAMDPELRAMQQITKILKDLDSGAQTRVISWVTEKVFAARRPNRPSEAMASSIVLDVSRRMD